MSGALKARLARLEAKHARPTVTIALLARNATPEEDAAVYAAARELVGPDGTVLGLRMEMARGRPIGAGAYPPVGAGPMPGRG